MNPATYKNTATPSQEATYPRPHHHDPGKTTEELSQQPCLLWLVGQGASAVGVPVGFGDGDGEGALWRLPLGMLTANASITLVCTWEERSISMVPCCPNPFHTITQCAVAVIV